MSVPFFLPFSTASHTAAWILRIHACRRFKFTVMREEKSQSPVKPEFLPVFFSVQGWTSEKRNQLEISKNLLACVPSYLPYLAKAFCWYCVHPGFRTSGRRSLSGLRVHLCHGFTSWISSWNTCCHCSMSSSIMAAVLGPGWGRVFWAQADPWQEVNCLLRLASSPFEDLNWDCSSDPSVPGTKVSVSVPKFRGQQSKLRAPSFDFCFFVFF